MAPPRARRGKKSSLSRRRNTTSSGSGAPQPRPASGPASTSPSTHTRSASSSGPEAESGSAPDGTFNKELMLAAEQLKLEIGITTKAEHDRAVAAIEAGPPSRAVGAQSDSGARRADENAFVMHSVFQMIEYANSGGEVPDDFKELLNEIVDSLK